MIGRVAFRSIGSQLIVLRKTCAWLVRVRLFALFLQSLFGSRAVILSL